MAHWNQPESERISRIHRSLRCRGVECVVLISYANQLLREGVPLGEAIRAAAHTRLRPVLMTALVAGVGFLPMALSRSQGSEVQRPLATVVIGGLITSTLLTLLVLPLMFELVEERWPRVSTLAAGLPRLRS